MVGRYVVFFVFASLIMGSAHYYLWARFVRDAALPAPWARIVTLALVLLFVVMMSAFGVSRVLPRSAASPIMWISYTWLGALFFFFMALAASDLARVVVTWLREPRGVPIDPERRVAIARLFGGAAALVGLGASSLGAA